MTIIPKEFRVKFLHALETLPPTKHAIKTLKTKLCKEFRLRRVPKNSELLRMIPPNLRKQWEPIFQSKPVRSSSGVIVVAVMTPPTPCPHGRCEYCPGGVEMGSPQSYTGGEPATLRGLQNSFDGKLQTHNRLMQYAIEGHNLDKIELIVMGGTFPATSFETQEHFIKECLDAITGEDSHSIGEAKFHAEASNLRNVGITLETRPDCASPEQIRHFLEMGVTRVEVGVQHPNNKIYRQVKRGHTVSDVVRTTQHLKDAGLKVAYHLMPNLPGATLEMDRQMFKDVFQDPRFKPDMLKIYPTLVLKGTPLYDQWVNGTYTAYSLDSTIKLLAEAMENIPPWIRIQRVQRDIPARLITAGPKTGTLTQLAIPPLAAKG
ncbi:MAG: tRNA uridine(34) 5-carboxymethylaminomethyl modification radical SAM/GNAT enzyme Elp3, partial [Candidatus Ranarchaeia archaeon]